MDVGNQSTDSILDSLSDKTGVPRKINKKDKIGCQARIEKYFKDEAGDPKGFEATARQQTQGRADVLLDQLEVNDDFGPAIDKKRVQQLANDISARPDPTQVCTYNLTFLKALGLKLLTKINKGL